jgi:hypothetical protein
VAFNFICGFSEEDGHYSGSNRINGGIVNNVK